MEDPWEQLGPLVQGMVAPTALMWALVAAMGQQRQKVVCTEVVATCSRVALVETWTTMSWLCGCQRACSVSGDTGLGVG